MRGISHGIGGGALLLAAWAVVGRFHGPPTLSALGQTFAASSALILANTLLLAAILLRLWARGGKDN